MKPLYRLLLCLASATPSIATAAPEAIDLPAGNRWMAALSAQPDAVVCYATINSAEGNGRSPGNVSLTVSQRSDGRRDIVAVVGLSAFPDGQTIWLAVGGARFPLITAGGAAHGMGPLLVEALRGSRFASLGTSPSVSFQTEGFAAAYDAVTDRCFRRPIPASLPVISRTPSLSPNRVEGAIRRAGSAFVVAPRLLLTSNHVIANCQRISVQHSGTTSGNARITAQDAGLDLALIETAAEIGPPLPFRAEPEPRRGEDVIAFGYPLPGVITSGPVLTAGQISALAGPGDVHRLLQISAPLHPGSSGGPVLDAWGNVVGVSAATLDAMTIARDTGLMPQNVNFAVRGSVVASFLSRHGVTIIRRTSSGPRLDGAAVGDLAEPSTVAIGCSP